MKPFKIVQFLSYLIFMIGIYLGFAYTLSMLTEVTTLTFFQDFLDPSVKNYVDTAQIINNQLFNLSIILVATSVLLYTFGFRRKILGFFRLLYSLAIGICALVINIKSFGIMKELNALYLVTDTAWPVSYGIPAELLGYYEPGNLFVGSGPGLYLGLTIISGIFILVSLVGLFILIKEKNNEKTK